MGTAVFEIMGEEQSGSSLSEKRQVEMAYTVRIFSHLTQWIKGHILIAAQQNRTIANEKQKTRMIRQVYWQQQAYWTLATLCKLFDIKQVFIANGQSLVRFGYEKYMDRWIVVWVKCDVHNEI